nr:12696_t:CDS:2 [Entrophospora candida]
MNGAGCVNYDIDGNLQVKPQLDVVRLLELKKAQDYQKKLLINFIEKLMFCSFNKTAYLWTWAKSICLIYSLIPTANEKVNCCRITQDSSLANAEQKEHSAENQLKVWILELRQKGMAAELNLK